MFELSQAEKDEIGIRFAREGGGVLSDVMIKQLVSINPLAESSPPGEISYGLTAYGYDMRIDNKYKIFTNAWSSTVDPKNFDKGCFVDHVGEYCLIPPNSFVLGVSVEEFKIPRDVLAICVGKSTYARCGLIVNVTPLEPEWRGKVTIEVSNTTPLPAKIYSGEGIAQVIFIKGVMTCRRSYADKKGKYQDQTGLTLPIVKPFSPQLLGGSYK